jgi:FtsP/CotA-like multicopper oxidase with cupredoxin domain
LKNDRKFLKIGYGALAAILAAFFLVPGSSFDLDNVTFDSANLFNVASDNSAAIETAYADDPKTHNIEMTTVELPSGQLAYQMVSHNIDGTDITEQRYGIDPSPTIPGPAIVIDEGDEVFLKLTNGLGEGCVSVHTHGVHYAIEDDGTLATVNKVEDSCASVDDGIVENGDESKTYHWNAAKGSAGTWPYHDHTFGSDIGAEEQGLFGVVIVNEPNTRALINGEIKSIPTSKIDKEYVLYMVGTTFWGIEIDNENGGLQTPLWVNPTLVAQLNDEVRFHVIGLGTAFHTFHMHAHKWVDQGTTDIVDVENIGPLSRTVFTVKAGEGVGTGDWMYHCHVFAHMQAGMSGIFRVTAEGGASLPGDSPLGDIVSFEVVDEPGPWFKNRNPIPGVTESLAIAKPGNTVVFDMTSTNTVHTITSLIWPVADASDPFPGATNMPVDQSDAYKGGAIVELEDPGLYVFTCKIHPYMFAAVIVDDEGTTGLDLGENIRIVNGITTPTASPLAVSLLKSFFIVTDSNNWQDYTTGTWNVSFPPVDVRATGGAVVNLSALDISVPLAEATPQYDGIGEVWVNTQFETTDGKTKYGTSTAVDTSSWEVTKKISLPEINMNHPHNMWTNTEQDVIYQTQWFDNRLTVFDRATGDLISDIPVGDAPSHVMTRPGTDDIFIAMNGDNSNNSVVQVNESPAGSGSYSVTGTLDIGAPHPHGHWMNADTMVTPNVFTGSATDYVFATGTSTITETDDLHAVGNVFGVPIATGMSPAGDKYYVANLLDQTVTCVSIGTPACNVDSDDDGVADSQVATKPIVLPLPGISNLFDLPTVVPDDLLPDQTGAAGLLPIQTPVSPDGKYVVTATLLPSITIIDTEIDELVLSLACDAGCHGVNFGANENGGYNAYVSSKFSNAMIVFDPESAVLADDGDGILDATESTGIVGRVILATDNNAPGAIVDDTITGFDGMGGQGVLAIPNPYDGWIEETTASSSLSTEVQSWINSLSASQQDPYP